MSDTTYEQGSEIALLGLDDLEHFWADNGLPIFMANRDDICDVVENIGFQIYYLLTNNIKNSNVTSTNPTNKVVTTTSVSTRTMQLFKVVNNFIGRVVTPSNDPFDNSFIKIEEEALYTMPSIPHVMIEKLDQFFRLVDAQHGTESIVMLTYDINETGPEGWGILVPDQSNTSVHCNYEPQSIADIKEDHIMIVGSVHSHPGMSAYASGTDHQDQADFDGIHITFGWQKSVNNGATQYYIEMQMAGKAYKLDPEDVFEDYIIEKAPDPEVVEWTEKVKKVLPPTLGGMHTPTLGQTQASQLTPLASTGSGAKPSVNDRIEVFAKLRQRFYNVSNISVEKDAIIVAEITPHGINKNFYCPLCQFVLDEYNLFNGYCDECYLPISELNTPISKIVTALSYYCSDLRINTNVPVYLWSIDAHNVECIMKIIEGSLSEEIRKEIEADNTGNKYNDFLDQEQFGSKLVCCNQYIDSNRLCGCNAPLTNSDLFLFDEYIDRVNVYDVNSDCASCNNYYDGKCTRYRNIITDWINNPDMNPESLKESINDEMCPEWSPYARESYSHYAEMESY